MMTHGRVVMMIARSVLIASCVAMLCGCMLGGREEQPSEATDEQLQRFAAGMMKASDLPSGWGHRRVDIESAPGGVGRIIYYSAEDPRTRPYITVSQSIVFYPTEEMSREVYLRAIDAAIPPEYADEWIWPEELRISVYADDIRVGCLRSSVNGIPNLTCRVVARYGDAVMTIYGSIYETEWITMSEFRTMLERVDERMDSSSPQR